MPYFPLPAGVVVVCAVRVFPFTYVNPPAVREQALNFLNSRVWTNASTPHAHTCRMQYFSRLQELRCCACGV